MLTDSLENQIMKRQKKKKKKRKKSNVQERKEKKKEKKRGKMQRAHHQKKKKKKKTREKKMNWTWAFLSIKQPYFLPSVFSSFWREFFGGLGEKISGPHHLFSFLITQPNTLNIVFLPIFSPKFSIHPISPPNKYTLRDQWRDRQEGVDRDT